MLMILPKCYAVVLAHAIWNLKPTRPLQLPIIPKNLTTYPIHSPILPLIKPFPLKSKHVKLIKHYHTLLNKKDGLAPKPFLKLISLALEFSNLLLIMHFPILMMILIMLENSPFALLTCKIPSKVMAEKSEQSVCYFSQFYF